VGNRSRQTGIAPSPAQINIVLAAAMHPALSRCVERALARYFRSSPMTQPVRCSSTRPGRATSNFMHRGAPNVEWGQVETQAPQHNYVLLLGAKVEAVTQSCSFASSTPLTFDRHPGRKDFNSEPGSGHTAVLVDELDHGSWQLTTRSKMRTRSLSDA
jgi:hypothetical protein